LNCLHKIIIADSSFIPESKENRKIIEYFRDKLDIYYKAYNSDINPYKKIYQTLGDVHSKYVVLCAEKDFIIPNGIKEAILYLEDNPDYSIAHGVYGYLGVQNELWNSKYQRITTKRESNCTINDNNALSRLKKHFQIYSPTFYSVYRTKVLLRIYMLLNEVLSSTKNPYGRMMELCSSGLSIINGKAKELDTLYQIRLFYTEPIFSSSRKHKLNSEINANDYPMIYKKIYNVFAEELIKFTDMDKEAARKGAKEALDIFMMLRLGQNREFNSQRNHNYNYYEGIIKKIDSIKRVLPVVMQSILNGMQLIPMVKSPINTYREILYSIDLKDSFEKACNEHSNTLSINKLLDSNFSYHSDFMPIYEIVKRYPYGIDH
jgi:glycosyltransferase domain-containing protein